MNDEKKISAVVQELAREGFAHRFGKPARASAADPEWRKVRDSGTALWLDTGDIEEAGKLWCTEFEALTTNNTLLNKEVQKGTYDELIGRAAAEIRNRVPGVDDKRLVLEVAFVLNARHGLRLVEQFDARVSVELHTDLAHDVDRTVAYGKRFYEICPERFYVKAPLTPAGYLGARKLAQQGVPINFTLGFSARQNYFAALLTRPKFVNVFLGRLGAFVADNRLGSGDNVGEKATLAAMRELLTLRKAGRTQTRLIAASMRGGAQVATLAGVDVLTMPTTVAAAYRQAPRPTVSSQTAVDPPIALNDSTTLDAFNGATLWDVPPAFRQCVDELLKRDVDRLTPVELQAHFEAAGIGDLLPRWSRDDEHVVLTDGKIPVLEHWEARLSAGTVGLDALMNLSALFAFVTDQKALDGRIMSLL